MIMSHLPRRPVLQRVSRRVSPGLEAGILVPENIIFTLKGPRGIVEQRLQLHFLSGSTDGLFHFEFNLSVKAIFITRSARSWINNFVGFLLPCGPFLYSQKWLSFPFLPVYIFFLYPAILNDNCCNNEFPKIDFDQQNFARVKFYPIMQNLSSISCRQAQSFSQPSLVCFGKQGRHKSIKRAPNP